MSTFYRHIFITNESTVLEDAVVADAITAFSKALSEDFKKFWNAPATLNFVATPLPPTTTSWTIRILDNSDQAGALGYHDTTTNFTPTASVFAKTDLDYGYNWTVTFTHELFEMLADPHIARAEQATNSRFYALEVGDPCEADEYAYPKMSAGGATIMISDFVTERWFDPTLPAGPFDFKGRISKALGVLPGGYAQYHDGTGWHQVGPGGAQMALEVGDPRFRDRTPHPQRLRSRAA